LNPIQINAAELLSLFQTVLWPAVITKNVDSEAENRFEYNQEDGSALNGNWTGQPGQVIAGRAFCVHFVENKRLVYVGDYIDVRDSQTGNGRYKLVLDNVQCYEILDWSTTSVAQSALRQILKQSGAVTYSYYFGPSDIGMRAGPCFRMAEVKIRLQQSAFRKAVFTKYQDRCVISGCKVQALLEAAHLPGKSWQKGDNGPDDGIPLRADLHRALDAELIRLNAVHELVYIDPSLHSEYGQYILKAK